MAVNKVLLVDDDPGIIEVLKLYFEKEGYQVSTCMQGDRAVGVFNQFKPDIVLGSVISSEILLTSSAKD